MARYKPVERGGMLIPVMLHEQIQPGTFEFALDHLVDHELDLSALDARFNNDEVGAPAYDPRVMLKIVLLAYSRGLISSRKIEQACEQNVLFMAMSGDSRPSFTHIARFVRELTRTTGRAVQTTAAGRGQPEPSHARSHRLAAGQKALQPTHRHRRAGVRQHPPPQAHEPLHAARAGQGVNTMAALLPGA